MRSAAATTALATSSAASTTSSTASSTASSQASAAFLACYLAFFLAFFICLRKLFFFLFFLPVRKSASESGAMVVMIQPHCFLPMGVPVGAVGTPRALLYDESAYESDWQWLPLARGQRYREYLMREICGERVESGGRPTATPGVLHPRR